MPRSADSPTPSATPPTAEKPWSRSGEGFARGVRYLACVAAGYLVGLAAGAGSGPVPIPVVLAAGAIGLFLVFRRGRASVTNAAADAVAAANARAAAVAANVNNITMAGGHVVHGAPPIEAYEDDVWAQSRGHEPIGAYEVGRCSITGQRLYEINGRIIRDELLTPTERARVVPIDAQLHRPEVEL